MLMIWKKHKPSHHNQQQTRTKEILKLDANEIKIHSALAMFFVADPFLNWIFNDKKSIAFQNGTDLFTID